MIKKTRIFVGFVFLLAVLLPSCNYVNTPVEVIPTENVTRNSISPTNKDSVTITDLNVIASPSMEIPETENEKSIIHHTAFSLLYSEEHEQAIWIAYELTSEETNKQFDRSDKFIVDPAVKTSSATNADYKGSGYDRGHLAPAADMSWSNQTMQESFYYSNMSPQDPSFNRGIWKKLEELVRTWAVENNSLYVVTGPILSSGLSTIGPNNVSVPNYYYKVLLDYSQPEIKAIGFILPNRSNKGSLTEFAVPIDQVEAMTGLNFFPNLPDKVESMLESSICISCWSWKANKPKKSEQNDSQSSSVQCSGITKKGAQCKRMTLDPSGFCYQHH